MFAQLLRIAVILILMDSIWLYIRSDYHRSFFANVQKSPLIVRWIPALIVYGILAYALLTVALSNPKGLSDVALKGALVGAVLYGFYDATNLATLSGWSWSMAITDTMWGALACSATATIIYNLNRR